MATKLRALTLLSLLLLLLTLLMAGPGRVAVEANLAPAGAVPSPDYGIAFISSAEDPADEQMYQNGLSTGAAWNRWPVYWSTVEYWPELYDWSTQDATVQADLAHGLQLNLILLGTPWFYVTGQPAAPTSLPPRPAGRVSLYAPEAATPEGLYEPVFSDGSDIPGPGKQINPANVWARFVFLAVDRYRPGGVLAQANGWPAGVGVTHWEMWNEPDLPSFWDGTLPDYARLLKVGFMAARQADANSQVLFGALANNFQYLSFYDDVLALYDADPLAGPFNYFHDILATHNYFVAERSWWHVDRAAQSLAARGLNKPLWLNESGVPAWDDYPGPVWDPTSGLRATTSEQADFVIQSALYATYAGADAIFHFQLYDGCGNQPRGTDFPPHNGELCDENGMLITDPNFPCAGDANGLFSNPADAACFRQHPTPEAPRPNYDAFRLLTTHFREVEPLWWLRPGGPDPNDGPQEWLAFYRPGSGERIVGLWARYGQPETALLPATSSSGLLLTPDGQSQIVQPENGFYTLLLPAATNHNAFWDPNLFAIGGRPYLLIEQDTLPPQVNASAPPIAWDAIFLNWSGDDGLGSGLANFDVLVAVDGGAFTPWLVATALTGGRYPAEPGHTYTFQVTGRDRAGNVSEPQMVVVTALVLDFHGYQPQIRR